MTGTHQSTDDPYFLEKKLSMTDLHSRKTEALHEQNCDCQCSCNHQHHQKDQPNLHRHRLRTKLPRCGKQDLYRTATFHTTWPLHKLTMLINLGKHISMFVSLYFDYFRLLITVSLQFQATRNMTCISPLQRKGHNLTHKKMIFPYLVQFFHQLTTLIPPECCNNFVESKQLHHQTLLHLFCRILGCY